MYDAYSTLGREAEESENESNYGIGSAQTIFYDSEAQPRSRGLTWNRLVVKIILIPSRHFPFELRQFG